MQNLQADHSVAHVIHEDWVCPMDFKWFSKVRDGPRHKLLQTIHRGNQDSNSKPTVPFWFDSNDDKWLGANLEVTEVQEKWYKEGWDQNQGRVGRGIPGPARAKNRQACCRGLGWRPHSTDRQVTWSRMLCVQPTSPPDTVHLKVPPISTEIRQASEHSLCKETEKVFSRCKLLHGLRQGPWLPELEQQLLRCGYCGVRTSSTSHTACLQGTSSRSARRCVWGCVFKSSSSTAVNRRIAVSSKTLNRLVSFQNSTLRNFYIPKVHRCKCANPKEGSKVLP